VPSQHSRTSARQRVPDEFFRTPRRTAANRRKGAVRLGQMRSPVERKGISQQNRLGKPQSANPVSQDLAQNEIFSAGA
jgi:hypothetical protein